MTQMKEETRLKLIIKKSANNFTVYAQIPIWKHNMKNLDNTYFKIYQSSSNDS